MPAPLHGGTASRTCEELAGDGGHAQASLKDRAEQVACRHEVTAKIIEAHWLAALAFIGTRRPLVPADPI